METLSIEKLSFGGRGVGRLNGKVCFVAGACPGDVVVPRLETEKRSYLTASISELIAPSPYRTEPQCPIFGTCGGCDWQQVEYDSQREQKRLILSEIMWRGSRVPAERIAEVVPAPHPYGYRSRVQFKLHGASGRLAIGFFRQGTHFVEDAGQGCFIAIDPINRALAAFRNVLADFPEPAMIPQISLEWGDQDGLAIVHYIGSDPAVVEQFFRERADRLEPVSGLLLQTGRKSTLKPVFGVTTLSYLMPDAKSAEPPLVLSCRAGSFSQVNREQNRNMLAEIVSMLSLQGDERLLDLYCGNGNFSLPLARSADRVTGIEVSGDSIESARENADAHDLTNVTFLCGDVQREMARLVAEQAHFDCILLDPPRSGAREVMADLVRLGPAQIIYVSCDPATLARDCALLVGGGYQVERCVPFDMFPQTFHVECVTLLRKKM